MPLCKIWIYKYYKNVTNMIDIVISDCYTVKSLKNISVFVSLDKTSGADIATLFAAYALGLVNYYAHTFHLPLQGHE